jgi:hypothetical protein
MKKLVMRLLPLKHYNKNIFIPTKMIKYLVGFFILLNISCNKSNITSVACFKGKLVLKGICMNYVIQITEGDVDKALYESSWQNPSTNTTYQNVFRLESICTFPSTIKEGDEFYFTIPKNPIPQTCAQCMAYSPTPNKMIYIEICNK